MLMPIYKDILFLNRYIIFLNLIINRNDKFFNIYDFW